MFDNLILSISEVLTNVIWLAPLVSFLAGILTSLTPCALSSLPLIVGYIGLITNTEEGDKKKIFKVSLIFSIGQALVFTVLATSAALLGKLLNGSNQIWYLVLGVLMLLMAFQTMDIVQIVKPLKLKHNTKKSGYLGAFLAGTVGGLFSSPCATPILIVLLGLVARGGNVFWGIFLLLMYSLGHSTLILLTGMSIGLINNLNSDKKYQKISVLLKYFMGVFIFLLGLYMLYLGL